uniref:Uncharacterized protein n=1 Tax=Phytophthora ramorum TaxID=164328 RepID=H3HBH8_PHYRM
MVIVEANVATCTHRVRHAVLKLYEVFIVHFMPKLNELYILDAKEDRVDVATGEKLLSFFNNEVDELELEDQKVRQRLYQRLRLAKLTQVLDMIMRATVRVKVMDEDRNNVDNYLGTACIPLMDLLDQQPRDDIIATHSPGEKDRGKHEAARRRLHAAVVPAQRRRWLTIKGYLDELTKQAQGKLHWERTPVLLSLVWDIFALQESSPTHVKKKAIDAEELEYTQSVAQVANAYRDSVMKELMTIQAAALIHAQRTPELLDDIEREIEGLDVGLSTAWQQVKQKWQILLNALEELVSMQERKLNLTRAPQLLKIVEQRCSKGLSTRHADAVSNIQSRWMAITQPNGPLSELRLMEKKGLHWRRTHELLLLLDEQCEGFADVDARALNTVQNRWEQVQEWLHEIVEMQQQHSIDLVGYHPMEVSGLTVVPKTTDSLRQEMVFTPANVRLALEDRGVIPKTSNFDPTADRNAKGNDSDDAWVSPSLADPKSGSQSVALPKTVLKEIEELEKMLEKHRDDSQQVFALPNPERVAELYQSMKSLGKSDLLWKVDHAVSRNRELAVPENYQLLLKEMTLRQIPTTEVENLVKSLAFTLQKETLLQERGMDRKGDPVILRGIRIGTQSTALRKRNSLVRTFAGESHVLDDEDERTEADMFAAAVENAEVDVSGDYMTLVERFQRLLVHEAYTKRLAAYAALDRCVRALLGKSRDETVTKEEIAMELHNINKRVIGANYRLPAEAFTKEELKQAVGAGRIRTPSDEMLARCPQGDNAHAMAHYAAISYAANVFQEVTSFRSRVDLGKNRLQDTFPFDECSSVDGVAIPKQWSRWTFSQSIADWLLGFDTSTLSIKRKLSAAHRQRLEWASAAFTLRNRWLQRGLGWCDPAFGEGVGVKILLDRLLLFEAANKMDMVKTEKLLREVRDKCSRLREREQEAQAKLEERYQSNLELLEKLVTHAERCMNNRKLHSEETPVLLHKLEQVCVVPNGLNERHREAYHKVATHWLPQQQHLTELVKMHREGTFSITRTPELLGKMNYHTEGKAGSEELSEDMVAASAQRVAPELQATFVDRKLNEVRLGQRKEASSLRLDLNTGDDIANQSVDDTTWKELSHSKRVAQPLSPHEKHTNWKVVRNAVAANAAFSASSGDKAEKFKLSLSEELKELLRSPSQWLTGAGPQEESIKPELYFPKEVVLETPSASLTGAAK